MIEVLLLINNERTLYNMKKYYIKSGVIVFLMICLSILLTLIPPIIYNYHSGMAWDNNLIDLWETCITGISSGLITLASVAITVKETRRIQDENSNDTNEKITIEHNERLKKEHRELTNTISIYIGKYITHTQIYFESIFMDNNLRNELKSKKQALKKYEDTKRNISHTENMTQQSNNNLKVVSEQIINIQNEIYTIKQKIYDNSQNGKRIIASECYFILKTQLSTIKEANDLLAKLDDMHSGITKIDVKEIGNENWVKENAKELINCFNTFRKKYEAVPYENI